MTEGLGIRIAILFVTATMAVIAAVLGFSEFLPLQLKIVLVAANAGLAVCANQLPSWGSAARASRALKAARVD